MTKTRLLRMANREASPLADSLQDARMYRSAHMFSVSMHLYAHAAVGPEYEKPAWLVPIYVKNDESKPRRYGISLV